MMPGFREQPTRLSVASLGTCATIRGNALLNSRVAVRASRDSPNRSLAPLACSTRITIRLDSMSTQRSFTISLTRSPAE